MDRTYIVESYKEYYANDVCKSNPKLCAWLKQRFAENTEYVNGMVEKEGKTNPYWHQVNLIYQQIEGISRGKKVSLRVNLRFDLLN